MLIIGVINNVVDIAVTITPDQLQTLTEMYPEHTFTEQQSNEDIGWIYDGVKFTEPVV